MLAAPQLRDRRADLLFVGGGPALEAGHDRRLEQALDDLQLRRQRRRLRRAGRQVQARSALPRPQPALEVVPHQLEQLRRSECQGFALGSGAAHVRSAD